MTTEPRRRRGCLKLTGIGCLGLIALSVAFGVLSALVSPTTEQSAAAPVAAERATVSPVSAAAATAAPAERVPANSSDAPTPAIEPTAEPTAEPTPLPGVGSVVAIEDVRWLVESAEWLGSRIEAPDQFSQAAETAGGFVRVTLVVENASSDERHLSQSEAAIRDAQGRTFKPTERFEVVHAAVDTAEMCIFEQLPANVPKRCTFMYEVPADAQGFQFIASNLAMVFTKETPIDLGIAKE